MVNISMLIGGVFQVQNSPLKKYQKENITVKKKQRAVKDPDLIAFHSIVKNLRSKWRSTC